METYASDLGVKILGVTEVGKTRPDCKKYEFFGNISHEKKGHHSLGFLVDPTIYKSVHEVTHEMPNKTSNVWAMVKSNKSKKNNIYIGLYYVPSKSKGNKNKRKLTLQSIRANIKHLRKTHGKNVRIIVMGDFNIHI